MELESRVSSVDFCNCLKLTVINCFKKELAILIAKNWQLSRADTHKTFPPRSIAVPFLIDELVLASTVSVIAVQFLWDCTRHRSVFPRTQGGNQTVNTDSYVLGIRGNFFLEISQLFTDARYYFVSGKQKGTTQRSVSVESILLC